MHKSMTPRLAHPLFMLKCLDVWIQCYQSCGGGRFYWRTLGGFSRGDQNLEGTIGGHAGQSTEVQASAGFYWPTNLMTILQQFTAHGLDVRISTLQLLLFFAENGSLNLCRNGSPVYTETNSLQGGESQDLKVNVCLPTDPRSEFAQIAMIVGAESQNNIAKGARVYHHSVTHRRWQIQGDRSTRRHSPRRRINTNCLDVR